jgi:hypothetical protein
MRSSGNPRSEHRRRRPTDKTRRRLLALAKLRAKRSGVPFTITLADVNIPARCPLLGIPLRTGRGASTYQSPTLDRFVSAYGYIPGNVAVISHRANTIKNNASVDELERIAAYCRLHPFEKKKDQSHD